MNINLVFDPELTPCANPLCDQAIRKLLIRNDGDTLENVTLRIFSTSDALVPLELSVELLEANASTEVPQACALAFNTDYLRTLCHKLTTEMVLSIYQEDRLLYSQAVLFDVLPAAVCDDRTEKEVITP